MVVCMRVCTFTGGREQRVSCGGRSPPICEEAAASHMVTFRSPFTAEVFQTLMNGRLVAAQHRQARRHAPTEWYSVVTWGRKRGINSVSEPPRPK